MGDDADHVGDGIAEDAGSDMVVLYAEPSDKDFDEDICEEERLYYKTKFRDLSKVLQEHLHCTSCDRHLGASPKHSNRLFMHPMLRTLVCKTCLNFYNSGEFEKGEDGSELYCRWCGQGGEVMCCSSCPVVFCVKCIKRNCGSQTLKKIESAEDWYCFKCSPKVLYNNRAVCWAVNRFCDAKNKYALDLKDPKEIESYTKSLSADNSLCCGRKREKNPTNVVSAIKRKSERHDKLDAEPDAKKLNDRNNGDLRKIEAIPIVKLDRASVHTPDPETSPVINLDEPVIKPIAKPVVNNVTPKLTNSTASPANPKEQLLKLQQLNPSITVKTTGNPSNIVKSTGSKNTPVRARKNNASTPASTTQPKTYNRRQVPNPLAPKIGRQIPNDNLNLSLDSLTQGLDFTALNAMTHIPTHESSDDVVCTPDLPMPMEEPEEPVVDDQEDDVQCLTPNLPRLVPRPIQSLMAPTSSTSNIINRFPASAFLPYNITSLTSDDVTINKVTGGLKFKIDPHTLNTNKMYRLPDGRIFAITPNAATPGGFSATIVTMSDTSGNNASNNTPTPPKPTRSKKASEATEPKKNTKEKKSMPAKTPTPRTSASTRNTRLRQKEKELKENNATENSVSEGTSKGSVEWLKYNLTDSLDVIEYVLQRLNKLKSSIMTPHLKMKSKEIITSCHNDLDQILNLTCKRMTDVRKHLDEGYKVWSGQDDGDEVSDEGNNVAENSNNNNNNNNVEADDDDDDVEIISDGEDKADELQVNNVKSLTEKSKEKPIDNPLQISQSSKNGEIPSSSSGSKSKEGLTSNETEVESDLSRAEENHIEASSPDREILGFSSPSLLLPQGSPLQVVNSPPPVIPNDTMPMDTSDPHDTSTDEPQVETNKTLTRTNSIQKDSQIPKPKSKDQNEDIAQHSDEEILSNSPMEATDVTNKNEGETEEVLLNSTTEDTDEINKVDGEAEEVLLNSPMQDTNENNKDEDGTQELLPNSVIEDDDEANKINRDMEEVLSNSSLEGGHVNNKGKGDDENTNGIDTDDVENEDDLGGSVDGDRDIDDLIKSSNVALNDENGLLSGSTFAQSAKDNFLEDEV